MRRVSAETQNQARMIEVAGERAASFFTKLRNEAIALFALFLGATGLKEFVAQNTQAEVAMGRTAAAARMTVQALGEWQQALLRAPFGVSPEQTGNALATFAQKITQAELRPDLSTDFMAVLSTIGVNPLDPVTKKARPTDQVILDIAQGLKKYNLDLPQTQFLLGQAGLGGLGVGGAMFLQQKQEDIQAQFAHVRQLGTIRPEDVKAGNELANAYHDAAQAVGTLATHMQTLLDGPLKPLLTAITNMSVAAREWVDANMPGKIAEWEKALQQIDWDKIGGNIKGFLGGVDDVVKALGGWKTVSEEIFALWVGAKFFGMMSSIYAMISTLNPFLATVLGVLAVANTLRSHDVATEEAAKAHHFERVPRTRLGGLLYKQEYRNTDTGEIIDLEEARRRWNKDDPQYRVQELLEKLLAKLDQSFVGGGAGGGGSVFNFGMGGMFASGAGAGPARVPNEAGLSPTMQAFLGALSQGEGGSNWQAYNPKSGASGPWQFIPSTNAEVSRETGLFGMDPVSQSKKAAYYASKVYRQRTGRDLEADVQAGGHDDEIALALNRAWTSLPGGSESRMDMQQWRSRLADQRAAYGPQRTATEPTAPPRPAAPTAPQAAPVPPAPAPPTAPEAAPELPIPPIPPLQPPPLPSLLHPPLKAPYGGVPIPGTNLIAEPPTASLLSGARAYAMNNAPVSQSTTTTNNNVDAAINGPITVNTQATDADGIARSIGQSLRKYAFVSLANTGLA